MLPPSLHEGYLKAVKKPMDLGTLLRGLHTSAYTNAAEFKADAKLIWENAAAYKASYEYVVVGKWAAHLELLFAHSFAERRGGPAQARDALRAEREARFSEVMVRELYRSAGISLEGLLSRLKKTRFQAYSDVIAKHLGRFPDAAKQAPPPPTHTHLNLSSFRGAPYTTATPV